MYGTKCANAFKIFSKRLNKTDGKNHLPPPRNLVHIIRLTKINVKRCFTLILVSFWFFLPNFLCHVFLQCWQSVFGYFREKKKLFLAVNWSFYGSVKQKQLICLVTFQAFLLITKRHEKWLKCSTEGFSRLLWENCSTKMSISWQKKHFFDLKVPKTSWH